MKKPKEAVNHPAHYGGDVVHEVYKCLAAWGLLGKAYLWNSAKYIGRAGKKGEILEDLKKARWYLDREIESLEGKGDTRVQESNVVMMAKRMERKWWSWRKKPNSNISEMLREIASVAAAVSKLRTVERRTKCGE